MEGKFTPDMSGVIFCRGYFFAQCIRMVAFWLWDHCIFFSALVAPSRFINRHQ